MKRKKGRSIEAKERGKQIRKADKLAS